MRFDAANVPIGYLVLESKTRPLGELADLGMYKHPADAHRPVAGHDLLFALWQQHPGDRHHGRSRPPAGPQLHARGRGGGIGDRQRGCAVRAISTCRAQMPLVPTNAMVADPQEMGNIPIHAGKDVYIRDVATIAGHHGHQLRLRLVNGRKSIYIPVVKKDTASTLTVVRQIHKSMPLVPVGGARGRQRALRVRRIADGAGGHQERGHRGR